MYALMRGTCSYLNIEERDIAGCLRYYRLNQTQTGSFAIILYDRTPGGSGHVRNLRDANVFENVLIETKRIITGCNCGGKNADTSCYSCLRSYMNQRVHDKLQRRHVLDFFCDF